MSFVMLVPNTVEFRVQLEKNNVDWVVDEIISDTHPYIFIEIETKHDRDIVMKLMEVA